MAKITIHEYEKATKYVMKYHLTFKPIIDNVEEFDKQVEIRRKFQKQNRFNPFTSLDLQYKDHIKYGKIARRSTKAMISIFVVMLISMSLIPIHQLFAIIVFVMIILLMPILWVSTSTQDKYYWSKREYQYNSMRPGFIREQKLKRILKSI